MEKDFKPWTLEHYEKFLKEKEEREKEQESICSYFLSKEFKSCYKKELPDKNKDIQDYYTDQAGRCVEFYDRRITSFYLPYGIKKMDSWLSEQIINLENSKFTSKELERMIKNNPHLHNVIKTNLLENLKLKVKSF